MSKYKNVSSYTPSVSYTYPGILTKELFQKSKIDTPALTEFAKIRQGIRSNEYLHLVQPLTSILSKAGTTCGPTYTGVGSITDRKITVGTFDLAVQWCKKDFQNAANSFLGETDLVADGMDGYELGGKLRQVWIDEVMEASRIDMWKIILFGNDTAAGSSAFSGIEGVWVKLFDGFGSYCVKPVINTLPKQYNSTLSADQALNTLRSTYEGASILLKQIPANQKVFWVTGSMWDNLYTSYESKQYGTELQFKYLVDGVAQLSFRGTPVRPLWIADYSLENDTTNPFRNSLRHFVIYTIPDNHIIGVENASDLNNVKVFYSQDDEVTKMRGEMRFGYNYLHCDLQAISY